MTDKPSINLTNIIRCRDRLFRQVMEPKIGQTINGEGLDRLAADLRRVLPSGVTRDVVFESIRHIAGHQITGVQAYQLAWRLAGNLPVLRAGQPVTPWAAQREDEWVPVQVLRCFAAKDRYNRTGNEFSFRVMGGTSCPMRIRAFWSSKVVRYVAARVGFSKPWHAYPFQKAEQLVGLRFLVFIEAARSRTAPEFHEIDCTASLIKWNRDNVLRTRLRVGVPCPKGWRHTCHNCAIGYLECPAGTHRLNYEVGNCNQCGKSDAIFDPEDSPSPCCISCTRYNRLRKTD